jgi:hypothetical protein
MKDFWYDIIPLAGIAFVVFLLFGLGQLIMNDMEQARYKLCIAADKQWVEGNCVK